MPGNSTFIVPPSGLDLSWPPANTVAYAGVWQRGIPALTTLAPTGVADCNALEAMTPPTLRTAYEVYAVSLAWSANVYNTSTNYDGNALLMEIALLVNGDVRWVGTDSEIAHLQVTAGVYIASGTINADLINPIRLNPRERLQLRLGVALTLQVSPPAGQIVSGGAWVGEQILANNTGTPVQSTISYQILDLPGTRSL